MVVAVSANPTVVEKHLKSDSSRFLQRPRILSAGVCRYTASTRLRTDFSLVGLRDTHLLWIQVGHQKSSSVSKYRVDGNCLVFIHRNPMQNHIPFPIIIQRSLSANANVDNKRIGRESWYCMLKFVIKGTLPYPTNTNLPSHLPRYD